MLSLQENQLDGVCRLCLTDAVEAGDMVPIFPIRGGNPNAPSSVVSRVLQCTSIKLDNVEGAPSTICEFCSARLEDWYAFREQCLGTDEYLKNTFRDIFYPEESLQATPYGGTPYQHPQPYEPPVKPYDTSNGSAFVDSYPRRTTPPGLHPSMALPPPNGDTAPVSTFIPSRMPGPNGQTMRQRANWSREISARINSFMTMVSGIRPNQCKLCNKLFKRRPHLRRHIKHSHIDEILDSENTPAYGQYHRMRTLQTPAVRKPTLKPVPTSGSGADGPRKVVVRGPALLASRPNVMRPYQCEVCKKCFKRSQHLARHKKSHLQIEIDRSQILRGIEEQKALEQLQQITGKPLEPDVIQLSDDDDDDDDDDEDDDDDDDFDDEDAGAAAAAAEEDEEDDDDDGQEVLEPHIEINGIPATDDVEEVDMTQLNAADDDDDDDVGNLRQTDVVLVDRVKEETNGLRAKRLRSCSVSQPTYLDDDDDDDDVNLDEDANSQHTYANSSDTGSTRSGSTAKDGAMQFRCKVCQRSFKRLGYLRAHEKSHDPTPSFQCSWCHKVFRYKKNYQVHIEKQTCRGQLLMAGNESRASKRSW